MSNSVGEEKVTAKKSLVICALLLLLPSIVDAQALIQTGITTTSNTSLTVANGTAFALPQGRGTIITWQTSFTANPTSITVVLRFSLDNVSYFTVDTSTSNSGELRYLGPISAKFIRCDVTAVVVGAGSGFQCKINVLGFNNATAFSGGTFTSDVFLASGASFVGPSIDNCVAGSLPFMPGSGDTDTGYCSNATNTTSIWAGGNATTFSNTSATFGSNHVPIVRIGNGGSLFFSASGSGGDIRFQRTATKTLTFDDGAAGAATFTVTGDITATANVSAGVSLFSGSSGAFVFGSRSIIRSPANGVLRVSNNGETRLLDFQSVDTPSCTSNCGTSPSVTGVGSSFTLTMGATGSPASGFVITFATAWAAAPQCHVQMAKAGMVIGKMPLTIVTTTTTATVVTNGTAPANSDIYHFLCSLGQ